MYVKYTYLYDKINDCKLNLQCISRTGNLDTWKEPFKNSQKKSINIG